MDTFKKPSLANCISGLLLSLIHIYRLFISSLLGNCCRFEPSCSVYAMAAIEKYGCLKGSYLILRRLLRCHPWHPGGVDEVK